MKYSLLSTVCAAVASSCLLWGGSAGAAPSSSFTPAQRTEIVNIVRQALLDDPTILTDAIHSLREKAETQKQDSVLAMVRQHKAELQTAPDFAIRGNAHGSVTIVEFLDPRCSYCRAMIPLVDRFLSRHPEVRLVEKLVPVLGSGSVLDTRAIFAASAQGKYGVMRQALMQDSTKPTTERVTQIAKANGLDVAKFTADMSSPQTVALITTNLDQGRTIGLDGTPTFIFGTAAVAPGALNEDQMDTLLERARKG
ncbi:DsbA family protein [Gluconobacter morbifer]|uniref:Outer membrane protein n=1 Tax=Gluconobacter morbifer G707 TaxID=1088869 RepID=G6XFI7_9PROT|nr:DsbA family protein [Gluconobacter morbifer]EHH68945.1 outer membrane protein [Gluconobacter morbifer G707]